ncbi:MAG: hypothetical protein IJH67_08175 [Thermoguttaceae bacterium]|nr:hypothetical protein [Thermoguttaceae bacterium]
MENDSYKIDGAIYARLNMLVGDASYLANLASRLMDKPTISPEDIRSLDELASAAEKHVDLIKYWLRFVLK